MEDKIEVGEYVRNESGYIHKVDSFDKLTNFFKDKDGKLKEWVGEDVFGNTIAEIIVKHSKDITDLIEVGDIVELVDVLSQEVIYVWDKEMLEAVKQDIEEGQKLKSILTDEQFKINRYEV